MICRLKLRQPIALGIQVVGPQIHQPVSSPATILKHSVRKHRAGSIVGKLSVITRPHAIHPAAVAVVVSKRNRPPI